MAAYMSEENGSESPHPPAADRLSLLWRRIGDHKVMQWAVAYVALAYAIQHAVTLTAEAFDWPHAVTRISMLLLALGLPLVMTFAWYHGAKANKHFSQAEMTIISILLVIGALVFYVFVRPSEEIAARPPAVAQAVTAVAPAAKSAGLSVAVLPFLNLSGDPKEEFFSDGMTEEITSALAKIPNLPVVGRTSAFAFKGKNENLRVIGQALGATYLLEGSVRQAGNRVRISAQLIRASDDHNVWTDSYDRDLKDVFAVQEDVAKAIAGALQVPLGLSQGETLVSNRTADTQSYEDYLRALALFRARSIQDVIAILEPMVKRDPGYAPAWALLAQAYNLLPVYVEGASGSVDELHRILVSVYDKAGNAARKANALDPKNAPAYTALAFLETQQGHFTEASKEFEKALALDPTDPETLHLYSLALLLEGRLKQALNVRTTLRKLEPFVPIYNVFTAEAMQLNGDSKGAIALLEPLQTDGAVGGQRNGYLALAYSAQGRYAAAADTLLKTSPDQAWVSMAAVKQAADIIRTAPARIVTNGPTLASESVFSFVYAFVGAPERFLDAQERTVGAGSTMMSAAGWTDWHPALSAMRKTEGFKALVRKEGLVDYWRATSWPDLCRPTTGDDFACN